MQGIQGNTLDSGRYFISQHPDNIGRSRNLSDEIQSTIDSTIDLEGKNKDCVRENIELLEKLEAKIIKMIENSNFCDRDNFQKNLSNIYLNRGKAYFLIKEFKKSKKDFVRASLLGAQDLLNKEILLSSILDNSEKNKSHTKNKVGSNKLLASFGKINIGESATIKRRNIGLSPFFKKNPTSPSNDRSATERFTSISVNEINTTLDLVHCLASLPPSATNELHILARKVIEAYGKERVKTPTLIREITHLAKIKDPIVHLDLINVILKDLKKNDILNPWMVHALAVIIYNTPKDLSAGENGNLREALFENLVEILIFTIRHLKNSSLSMTERKVKSLLMPIVQFLDRAARENFFILDFKKIYEPLKEILDELTDIDSNLGYQARYAFYTLSYIKSDKNIKEELIKKSLKIAASPIYLGSAIKNLDPDKFLEFINSSLQTYEIVKESLIEKGAWYLDLRIVDHLFEQNKIVELEKFAWNSLCHQNKYFLQGFCEYLARIARTQPLLRNEARSFLISFERADHWGKNETVIDRTKELVGMLDGGELYFDLHNAPPAWDPWWQLPPSENKLLDAVRGQDSSGLQLSDSEMKRKCITMLKQAIEDGDLEKAKILTQLL